MGIRRLGGVRRRQAELTELRARLARAEQQLAEQDFARRHAEDRLADAERRGDALAIVADAADQIAATTTLVRALAPTPELISVVMPTRNRAHVLPRAVASVQAQGHAAWELLVVDDGSSDETADLLAAAAQADPRIRILCGDGGGASAARNLALDHANGTYVAYLDDDNVMGPQWLRGLVWAFDRHPEAQIGYGARVMDNPRVGAPWIEFQPWDRQRMQVRCLIDQNVLAHRAGVPELRYDVSLDLGSDWDAAIRATEHHDPVTIPIVSTIYGAGSGDRLSERPEARLDWVRVQRAALRRHPLRVLGVDLAQPPLNADDVARAVQRWRAVAADPAWCTESGAPAPGDVPCFDDLETAIKAFGPAVVALHAGRVAPVQLDRLVRAGRAFVIVAPRESHPDQLAGASCHPLCAGVWGPHGPTADELLQSLDLVRARQLGVPEPERLLARAAAFPRAGMRSSPA